MNEVLLVSNKDDFTDHLIHFVFEVPIPGGCKRVHL